MTSADLSLALGVVACGLFSGLLIAVLALLQQILKRLSGPEFTVVMQRFLPLARRTPVNYILVLTPVFAPLAALFLGIGPVMSLRFVLTALGLAVFLVSPLLVSTFGAAPGFRLSDTWWLVLDVFGPVSMMLFGGYALAGGRPLGVFMAWWAALYGIVEALLQYRLEFAGGGSYAHQYFLGAIGAACLLTVCTITVQRLLGSQRAEEKDALTSDGLSDRQANLWMAFFATLIVVYSVQLFTQSGLIPVAVITASMTAGLVAWRLTTARRPADPHTFVPLYLLMLGLFYVHVGEEVVAPLPFSQAIAAISGTPWSDADFTFLIILIGPVVWVFGAWSLWKRQPFGNAILWYMTIGMILGEPSHLLVFPVMAMNKFGIGYQYFAGMYTALFPMIPAILALRALLRGRRRVVTLAAAPQA